MYNVNVLRMFQECQGQTVNKTSNYIIKDCLKYCMKTKHGSEGEIQYRSASYLLTSHTCTCQCSQLYVWGLKYCFVTNMGLCLHNNIQEFEDTEGVIRIHKSKKNRQHNDQKKKEKRTNNDLHKTKDRVKKTQKLNPTNTGVTSGSPEG